MRVAAEVARQLLVQGLALLAQQLLAAHAYWRLHGLEVDLILLIEEPTSYIEDLFQEMQKLIRSSDGHALADRPGGIFLRTEAPQEVGAIVYLQFSLKDGSRLIEGMGRVVRVNPKTPGGPPAGMGVEFLNFDEESMALIEEICAQRGGPRS